MTDLQTNLQKLEALYEARHKTDHVFINWWVGTFVLGVLTGGLYLIYRFMKSVQRRNTHIQRTLHFYNTFVGELRALNQYQQDEEILESLLEPFEDSMDNKIYDKLLKPLQWWVGLVCIVVAIGLFTFFMGGNLLMCLAYPPYTIDWDDFTRFFPSSLRFSAVLTLPSTILFGLYFLKRLLTDFVLFDNMEEGLLKGITPIVKTLLKNEQWELSFTKQCQPRNFWLHLALTLPTLGLNWIYVDYRLTVEAQKRFAESARVQGAILQALKQLEETSSKSTEEQINP